MTQANSLQEALYKRISALSVGAPFAFMPERWCDNKEPADVAWHMGEVLFLFYMTRRHPARDAAKSRHVTEKAIRHNLDQARSSIGRWRREERAITGRNRLNTFSIKASQIRHVVVVSAIDVPAHVGEFHVHPVSSGLCSMAISLPADVLEKLIGSHASPIDLVFIGDILRCISVQLSHSEVDGYAREYINISWNKSGAKALWPETYRSSVFQRSFHVFRSIGFRVSIPDSADVSRAVVNYERVLPLVHVMNDMLLHDLLKCCAAVERGMKLVTAKRGISFELVECKTYDHGIICASDVQVLSQCPQEEFQRLLQHRRTGIARYGFDMSVFGIPGTDSWGGTGLFHPAAPDRHAISDLLDGIVRAVRG